MASIKNCWVCNKSLLGLNRPLDSFFWCTKEHQKEYEERIAKSLKSIAKDEEEEEGCVATPSFGLSKVKQGPVGSTARTQSFGGTGDPAGMRRAAARVRRLGDSAKAPGGGPKKRLYTCGKCGEKGHNARSCNKA